MITFLEISLSSGNISLICNLVLLVFALFCLVSAFLGIKKGLWKSLVKLIVWIGLLLVVYTQNIRFTEFYFNFDLSFLINALPVPKEIVYNDTSIPLTQSLGGIVEQFLIVLKVESSTAAVTSLAMSILSFAVLIINLFLCLLLSPILTFILYRLILRPIFGKFFDKHKLRIGGFFFNGIKTALVAVCFLMPLFSTTEVLLKNYEDSIGEDYTYDEASSNAYWNMIYPIIFGYQGSILHQFCSLVTGEGSYNTFFTVISKNGNEVNFLNLTGQFFSVACSALSTAQDTSQSALIAAALSEHTLDIFMDKILSSAYIVSDLFPVIASLGVSMLANGENAILSTEDADRITQDIDFLDFKADLSSYLNFFKILEKNGIASSMVSSEGFVFEFSRENQDILNDALDVFEEAQDAIRNEEGKKTILDVIAPPLLAAMVRSSNSSDFSLSSILPTSPEEYEKYDMINTLRVFSDVLFNLNDFYKETLDTENNLSNNNFDQVSKNLLKMFFERENVFDGVKDSRDAERKIRSLSLFSGLETAENTYDYGLLDSSLILDCFPVILDMVLNIICSSDENAGGFTLTEEMKDRIEEVIKTYDTKEEWANELDYLMKFISLLYNNPDLPLLNDDGNGGIGELGYINIEEENQRIALQEALTYIDGSIVASTLLPAVIADTLNVESLAIFADFGIDIDDFNFTYFTENTGLGTELSKLLDAYGYIAGANLSGNFLTDTSFDTTKLKEALLEMEACEIINPSDEFEELDPNKNVFKKMLMGLFNTEEMHQIGIELTDETYEANRNRMNGENGEISSIIQILDTVRDENNGLNKLLSSDQEVTLQDLNGDDIELFIHVVADSEFFRPCIANILQKQAGGMLESNGIYLNYELMDAASKEEWYEEASTLGDLLDGIKGLLGEESFDEIDWLGIIQEKDTEIHSLLNTMVSLKMMDGELFFEEDAPQDRFGYFLTRIMKLAFQEYFSEENTPQIQKEFSFYYYLDELNIKPEDFHLTEDKIYTRVDYWNAEIQELMDVFSSMKSFIIEDEEGNKTFNIVGVDADSRKALRALLLGKDDSVEGNIYGINDLYIMRTLLSSIATSFFGQTSQFGIEGLSLNKIHQSLLNEEYDYLSPKHETNVLTRLAEIEARKEALGSLLNIEENISTLKDILEDESPTLASFSGNVPTIFSILHEMKDSAFFHKGRYGREELETTFFEDAMGLIMKQSKLSLLNYDSERDALFITSENDEENAANKTQKQILNLSTLLVQNDQDTKRTWDEELESLESMLTNISQNETLQNITSSNAVNDLNVEELEPLLKNLNQCYLTHDAVGNLIKIVLDQTNIAADFRMDEEETATLPDYYLDKYIRGEMLDFGSQVKEWNDEITNILKMKETLDTFVTGDSLGNMFGGEDAVPAISELLSVTGASRILKPMYSDFLYTLLDKAGLSNKISIYEGEVTCNGEVLKKETNSQQRRNTIQYLINERIRPQIDKENGTSSEWAKEGDAMDKLLNIVKNGVSFDGELTEENSPVETISKIFTSVYNYSGAAYDYSPNADNSIAIGAMVDPMNYERAYIASEILLNFFDQSFEDYSVSYFKDIHSTYNYECFNDYEKEGLLAILKVFITLGGINGSNVNQLKFDTDIIRKMGPGTSKEAPFRDAEKTLLKDGWNSNICYQLLNGGYLEKALANHDIIDEGAQCFTMEESVPIEFSSSSWATKIIAAATQHLLPHL